MAKAEKKKRSRWRWVWRVGGGILVLLILVLAIPFVFTGSVVRWGIGRSGYERFSPEVGSATLSVGGELELRDVVLHELPPHRERVLVKAGKLRVRFGWGDVFSSTVQDVRAEDVTVYARGGENGGMTVAELWGAEETGAARSAPATQASSSVAASAPFWMDHLDCVGRVEVEGLWGIEAAGFPFEVSMQMSGARTTPTRRLSVAAGELESGRVSGRMVLEGEKIRVEELVGRELHGVVAKELLAKLPTGMQKDFDVSLGSLDGHGEWDGRVVRGHLAVTGIDVASTGETGSGMEVIGLAVAGDVEGAMSAEFLRTGSVTAAKVTVKKVTYGKNQVDGFESPVTVEKGELAAPVVKLGFAKADIAGAVKASLAERRLISADFTVKHLDQGEVAENMAPDRLDAEGTMSGEIHLKSDAKGVIVGDIVLNSDGPGRLQIKDQQTAEALAQKLQVGAAGGVLPSNFSTIVVAQLKDYPYTTGHIGVSAPDGVPVVTLNYQREGVKPGEPGYGVKATIAGQAVTANYTVQLPGLTVVLKGKTVEEILALATGLEQEVAGEGTGK